MKNVIQTLKVDDYWCMRFSFSLYNLSLFKRKLDIGPYHTAEVGLKTVHVPSTPLAFGRNENTSLFDVLPERILCGKVQYKAGATTCSTRQNDK